MIVSSVYSWLKDIRSTCDTYEDKSCAKRKGPLLIRRASCNHCKHIIMPLACEEDYDFNTNTLEGSAVFLRGNYQRRSYQKNRSDSLSRMKKAWSVGDAWGVNFLLQEENNNKETRLETVDDLKFPKAEEITSEEKQIQVGSEASDDTDNLSEVLKEFAFLSDVEQDFDDFDLNVTEKRQSIINNEPIYMNIEQIRNDKLAKKINYANVSSTLSSTYSFVSLAPSENSISSDYSTVTPSSSSGTYTIDQFINTSTSSCSLPQSSSDLTNWKSDEWNDILHDQNEEKCPDYESACKMPLVEGIQMRKHPLKKGKSLDSFTVRPAAIYSRENKENSNDAEVELRRKVNRQSVIPIVNIHSEMEMNNRKAIIVPKNSNYLNIWECHSKVGKRPIPTPRKNVNRNLRIQHGRENIVSFAFDETVELLEPKEEPAKADVDDRTKNLPSMDVIMWLYRLVQDCEYEPEFEIPTPLESSSSHRHDEQTLQNAMERSKPTDIPDSSSPDIKSNEFDFNNLKKYKIDNQVVKLTKNDVIKIEDDKLLHENNRERKVLAENMIDCQVEQRSPKEQVLKFRDKEIHLYREKKPAKSDSNMTSVRTRLMQLFKTRPAVETLQAKMIYKNETIFGNTLTQLEQKHKISVPALVTKCIEFVELPRNITTEGLYRSSASFSILQDIRFALNENECSDMSILDKYKYSPDVPSGLLKYFIRELKESLISEQTFKELCKINENFDIPAVKYQDAMTCIETMVQSHKETLKELLKHLLKVAECEAQNGMNIISISICWGQTMCSFPDHSLNGDGVDNKQSIYTVYKQRNEVVQLLLKAYKFKMEGVVDPNKDTSRTSDVRKESLHSKSAEEIAKENPSKHQLTTKSSYDLHTYKDSSIQEGQQREFLPSVSIQDINFIPKLQSYFTFAKTKPPINYWRSNSEFGSMDDLSICSNMDSERSQPIDVFIDRIITLIEQSKDRGVYVGKGDKKKVQAIIRKYKKPTSKTLDKLLSKVNVFTLGCVLGELIRESNFVFEFNEIQLLVQDKQICKDGQYSILLYRILEKIPEIIYKLFSHFERLLQDPCGTTIVQEIYDFWWPIIIAAPKKSAIDVNTFKDVVGRNLDTFQKLIHVVLENYRLRGLQKQKSRSMGDLINIADGTFRCETSCCSNSSNRFSPYYGN